MRSHDDDDNSSSSSTHGDSDVSHNHNPNHNHNSHDHNSRNHRNGCFPFSLHHQNRSQTHHFHFPYIMNRDPTERGRHLHSPMPQGTPRSHSPATPLGLQPRRMPTLDMALDLPPAAVSRHSIGLDVPGVVQTRYPKDTLEHHSDSKLVVVMVGLPARGKSYVVKKLRRYLNWLQYETKVFNVGNRRRSVAARNEQQTGAVADHSFSFFDPNNAEAKGRRDQLAMETLEELIDWLHNGGRVAIHDATNSTLERRKLILDRMRSEPGIKVLFIESICNDTNVLEKNMRLKLSGPDYRNKDPEEALRDFKHRVNNYEQAYQPIEDDEEADIQYCKLINVGKKVIAYNINGYLSGQCVFYLMNFNLAERQIFLTRHGESEDNINGIIGGDAPLSPSGKKFGAALTRFVRDQRIDFAREQSRKRREESLAELGHHLSVNGMIHSGTLTPNEATHTLGGNNFLTVPGANEAPSDLTALLVELASSPFMIWTSMLKRTMQTVEEFDPSEYDIKHIRFLNEIYAGVCEGLTYDEIKEKFPGEAAAREQNKLYYRYPGMGGESYLDVIHRLQPLIIELERMTQSCLIITHRVVMRILLGYLLDWSHDEMPHMHVPLHSVYELRPKPYGTELKKWKYLEEEDRFVEF